MVSEAVLSGVISELKLGMTPGQLNKSIQVDPVRDTQLIQLSANNTDPVKAAMILDKLIDTFINEIGQIQSQRFEKPKVSLQKQLDDIEARINITTSDLEELSNTPANREERNRLEQNLTQYRQIYSNLLLSFEQIRLAEAQATNTVVRVEDPSIPTSPVLPRTTTNVILAGLVGFLFSCGLVLLIEAFDDTIKGPEDVTRHLGLPVLGMIARYDKDVKLITSTQPRSPITEAYRSIRTNLQFASIDKPIHTLLITSPSPEDGKSSVASNLGIVMAQSGRKVALIDADLRRPNLHKIMAVPNRKGITSLLSKLIPTWMAAYTKQLSPIFG
jgi:non-specific protein-tyrosine kinase